jgi:hypothetical protein
MAADLLTRSHVFDVTITCSFAFSSNLIEEGDSSFESDLIRAFDGIGGIFWKNFQWPLFKKIWSSIPKPFLLLENSNDANFSIIAGVSPRSPPPPPTTPFPNKR